MATKSGKALLGTLSALLLAAGTLAGCEDAPPQYTEVAQKHCRAVLGWMSRKAGRPNVVELTVRAANGEQIVEMAYELFEIVKPSSDQDIAPSRIFFGRIACTYPGPSPGSKVQGIRGLRARAVLLNGRELSDKQVHSLNTYVLLLGG